MLLSTAAWADQIILKNGTVYSGKFIRGDSKIIEFRVLGRVESFQTAEISQIVFKEPEVESSAKASPKASSPAALDLNLLDRKKPRAKSPKRNRRLRTVRPTRSSTPVPVSRSHLAGRNSRRQIARQEPSGQDNPASSLTIPAGMAITVRTATEIDTERNRVGDTFEAMLDG